MTHTIHTQLAYSAWANGKLAEILKSIDASLFERELKSSFPTVRGTLLHICDAETIWHTRLRGEQITTWPSQNFNGDKQALLELFAQPSQALRDFAAQKDDAFFSSVIHYRNIQGKEFSQDAAGILFHVVNHGSFHRGQVVTMLRELGHTQFESTDLITYLRTL